MYSIVSMWFKWLLFMPMRKYLKRGISFFLIPLTKWYLRKERNYRYNRINIKVFSGVFHPGLFYSTKFLLQFLEGQSLRGKSFLELGCGTGLVSIASAKKGAKVTACDLSRKAIDNCKINAAANQVSINILHSDLFGSIPKQTFDWIIINPPYYAQPVKKEEDLAWYCGEQFEYFEKLFSTINEYISNQSQIIMVLTLGCNLDQIFKIANRHHFHFQLIQEKKVLFDGKDFLYRIQRRGV
jgi:release factor glutamine methyltransferase